MNIPEDDQVFLKELVKTARQKTNHIKWVDRDGTDRQSTLGQAEVVRLNAIAHRVGVSKGELLHQATFLPVVK